MSVIFNGMLDLDNFLRSLYYSIQVAGRRDFKISPAKAAQSSKIIISRFTLHHNLFLLFRLLVLFITGCLLSVTLFAQVPDSIPASSDTPLSREQVDTPATPMPGPRITRQIADTTQPETADTVQSILPGDTLTLSYRPIVHDTWDIKEGIPVGMQLLEHHPYYKFNEKAIAVESVRKKPEGKETIFYVLVGLLLVFALLKQGFGKYFSDLFRVFFQTTLKQRQIREQLMQNPFPSLVFNIFFVASAGLYVNFMLHYFGFVPHHPELNFWIMYLYCSLGLAIIYTGKYIGLKIVGWLFNMQKAASSYTFIVFIINKVIGIFLLPFLLLLAFAQEPLYSIALVLSWCGIGALLLYRFILGFGAIRNEVRFNLFHFFLYLCAFEIAPLLLIYKLLLLVF